MHKIFKDKFNRIPIEIIDDGYYFGSKEEGDQFSDEEVQSWVENGQFERVYYNGRNDKNKDMFMKLANIVVEINLPYLEIACGPGLGITPFIKSIKPELPSLVTDACPSIVKYWNKFIKENKIASNMSFASFDNRAMPLYSESFDVITSYLGIGSTRNDGITKMNCINEIYRVLKHGGYFLTIENEIDDYSIVDDTFITSNKYNYYKNPKEIGSLRERLEKAGFTFIAFIDIGKYLLNQDDSELGALAKKQGKEVYWAQKVVIVKK